MKGGGYNVNMITLDGRLYIPLPVLTATNSLPAPRSMYPRYTNPDSPTIIMILIHYNKKLMTDE